MEGQQKIGVGSVSFSHRGAFVSLDGRAHLGSGQDWQLVAKRPRAEPEEAVGRVLLRHVASGVEGVVAYCAVQICLLPTNHGRWAEGESQPKQQTSGRDV